jgi:hypothetical protein
VAGAEVRVPEMPQRVRQRLDAVFEDAIFHGLCSANPAAAIKWKMAETRTRPVRRPATGQEVRKQGWTCARLEFEGKKV